MERLSIIALVLCLGLSPLLAQDTAQGVIPGDGAGLGSIGGVLPDAPAGQSRNVEIIVNPALYSSGQISAGLNQYLADVRDQGYNPILTTTAFATPDALRSHLAAGYSSSGLAGAVFVGDMPVQYFERNGQYGNSSDYQRFPCDLYYQDLTGTWSDATGNGTYDTHTGNVAPEIWMGRILTSRLTGLHSGRSEAGMMNDYFQKDHAYRTKQLTASRNGLAYIDDDWIPWAPSWANNLKSSLTGQVTTVQVGATTNAADYKARLANSYESVLLAAHSDATYHSFKIGSNWTGGSVSASELTALNPQALFYNLFCCSNADYTASNYMAGEYVFGTQNGLLAVGSAKTGSMLDFGYYYTPLGQGKTFGDSLQQWWLAEASNGFSDDDKDWFYGMTMIGDPLLLTQQYIPEPATLMLLALGMLAMQAKRRSQRGRVITQAAM